MTPLRTVHYSILGVTSRLISTLIDYRTCLLVTLIAT